MMLEVNITETVDADIDEMSTSMRDIDVKECKLVLNMPIRKTLQVSRSVSYETFTGRVNGELVAIFGISKLHALSNEAIPWLLATPLIEKYAFTFLRKNKEIIDVWKARHPIMYNHIHVDNKLTIRWLKWLGFEVKKPEPYGLKGELFHLFELRGK